MIAIPRDCRTVVLEAGAMSASVTPGCGARIASLRLKRDAATVDLLRPATPQALESGDAYGTCGFPLVPYSGPIFGGGFAWGGAYLTWAYDGAAASRSKGVAAHAPCSGPKN